MALTMNQLQKIINDTSIIVDTYNVAISELQLKINKLRKEQHTYIQKKKHYEKIFNSINTIGFDFDDLPF